MKDKNLPMNTERLFNDFLQSFSPIFNDPYFKQWMSSLDDFFRYSTQQSIPIEMKETEQEWIIRARIPNTRREDIEVRIWADHVKISALHREELEEKNDRTHYYRRQQSFQRTEKIVPLPAQVDPKLIRTHYEHGVLVISAPKK